MLIVSSKYLKSKKTTPPVIFLTMGTCVIQPIFTQKCHCDADSLFWYQWKSTSVSRPRIPLYSVYATERGPQCKPDGLVFCYVGGPRASEGARETIGGITMLPQSLNLILLQSITTKALFTPVVNAHPGSSGHQCGLVGSRLTSEGARMHLRLPLVIGYHFPPLHKYTPMLMLWQDITNKTMLGKTDKC